MSTRQKASILIILFTMLISCETMDNININSINENSINEIENAEILLVKYKFTKDKSFLKEANIIIKKLDELAENNKNFEAKIFGLYGEIALLQNNITLVNESLSEIERRNKKEEKLYILRAEVEKNRKEQKIILLEGIKKASSSTRLKLIFANNHFYSAKYKEAVDLFDEVFTKLPETYEQYYIKSRNLSYRFISSPPQSSEIIDILLRDKMNIKEMIQIILSESDLFASIFNDNSLTIRKIYEKFKGKKYFYFKDKNVIGFNDLIMNKDIAYFLLHLISDLQNDTSLLNKYSSNLAYEVVNEELSPIKDVKINDYFFNAVLVLVEKEILELPDGESFFPKKTMSCIRFYEIIIKLDSMY